MRLLVVYLPALVCGAMLSLICLPMLLGRNKSHSGGQFASQLEVAELREEIARLKAERVLSDKENVDG